MDNIDIESSTETVYRWKCFRCGGVGPYELSYETAEACSKVHEDHMCLKLPAEKSA